MRRIDPKLQLMATGSTRHNVIRAEHAAALRALSDAQVGTTPAVRGDRVRLTTAAGLDERDTVHARGAPTVPEVEVSVFVRLRDAAASPVITDSTVAARSGRAVTARRDDQLTAELTLDQVAALERRPEVAYIEPGQPLSAPTPDRSVDRSTAPPSAERAFGDADVHGYGEDVLIGIIDVEGFDFSHPEFVDDHGTRFARIWDQAGTARVSPAVRRGASAPGIQDYGAEFHKPELDAALASERQGGLPAWRLEPQSQRVPGSHGTHVASIAAGAHGVCRRAPIAAVLLALDPDAEDRRRSFYDSTRLAHAVDYLFAMAGEMGRERGLDRPLPVSINISLGTNGHAHDGTSAVSRWIDAALSYPGRAVCVAAGNAGHVSPEHAAAPSFVTGPIHHRGHISAAGLVSDLEWQVVGNTVADVSENEMEVWYSSQDRVEVSVKPPGLPWVGPITGGEHVENHQLTDGTLLSIYNELYYPANGMNRISVFLAPFFASSGEVVGVRAGTWLVRLQGHHIRDGRYHAWIERDDPRRLGPIGASVNAWRFPSYFSARTHSDESTVSSLACGQRVVSVTNYDDTNRMINNSSSDGPTGDGRPKPDLAAPGTDIVAANGFARRGPADRWTTMTGTSMASPLVAGVVGLMLAIEPRLTAPQISGILRRTSRPLAGADYQWRKDAGFGVIDPAAAIEETRWYSGLPRG
ncbi:MAG TPA: S8 family serine peptidase [Euzebyales bacterium]